MIYGIGLGFVVVEERDKKRDAPRWLYTALEIIVFGIIAFLVYYWNVGKDFIYFKRAPLSPIIAVSLVYLFYMKKGLITRMMTCKPMIIIGNRSGSAFLIHFLVTVYFVLLVLPFQFTYHELYVHVIYLIMCFSIVMALSWLYDSKISPWIKSMPKYFKTHSTYEYAIKYLCPMVVFAGVAVRLALGRFVNIWLPSESLTEEDIRLYSELLLNFSLQKILSSGYPLGYSLFLHFTDLTNLPYSIWLSGIWGGAGFLVIISRKNWVLQRYCPVA
jgi:hypothetical protein